MERGLAASNTRIDVCATKDVAPGTVLRAEAGDLTLAVYNVEGVFYVTDDHCTHGPGSLSAGYLDGYVIECDFHNGAFDIRTGAVVAPPCMIPVQTYKVVVEGDRIQIET